MGEDRLVPAMSLIDGGPNRFVRQSGKGRKRGGRVHLQAIRTAIEELLRCGKGFGGVRHLGLLDNHKPEGSHNGLWRHPALTEQHFARRADSRTWDLAGLDTLADPPGVLPGRPEIEHAREAVAREHGLKLAGEFGRRNIRGVRPLDRKSTRLNSSHRTISYAVFCLKKK